MTGNKAKRRVAKRIEPLRQSHMQETFHNDLSSQGTRNSRILTTG